MVKVILILTIVASLCGCAHQAKNNSDLYQKFGGMEKIEQMTDFFIEEISFDNRIYPFFAETKIERFREKFIEQICAELGGPCQYSGDSMKDSHAGMDIRERDFNRLVELLIVAMERANISYPLQNQLLNKLAPMREQILP